MVMKGLPGIGWSFPGGAAWSTDGAMGVMGKALDVGPTPRPSPDLGMRADRIGHWLVISRTRARARCLSGSGRIKVRLSRVSQLRAVRTWSRYSPAAWMSP